MHNLRVVMLLENASSLTRINELKNQPHINDAEEWTSGGVHYYIFVKAKNKTKPRKAMGQVLPVLYASRPPRCPKKAHLQPLPRQILTKLLRLLGSLMAPGSEAGAALSFPNSYFLLCSFLPCHPTVFIP